jgi:hypothetical protein
MNEKFHPHPTSPLKGEELYGYKLLLCENGIANVYEKR